MTSQPELNRRALEMAPLHSLGKSTINGSVIALGGQVSRVAIQLATSMTLARLLAPGDFGLVAMAGTVTSFVGLFTDLGLTTATVQRRQIDQETVTALFLMNVGMGLLVMLAAAAAAPFAAKLFKDPRVFWIVIALAALIPINACGSQHVALLQRGMRWTKLQLTGIVAQLIAAAVAVGLAWQTDLGYWALVAQAWTGAVVSVLLFWSVCRWRPSTRLALGDSRSALRFGLGLTGSGLINYFHRQLDNVLVGWRWGATELGYYSRAYSLLLLPLSLVSGPVTSAVLPALSRLQDDTVRWRRTLLESLGALSLVSCGIAAVLASAAAPIVEVLYGHGWRVAGQIFGVLSLSMFPVTAANAMGWIYVSLGRTSRLLIWNLIGTPPFILAFSIGVQFGALGVAAGYTITNFMLFIPEIYFACHGTPVRAAQVFAAVLPFSIAGGATVALVALERHFLLGLHLSVLAEAAAISASALTIYAFLATIGMLTLDTYVDLRRRIRGYFVVFISRIPKGSWRVR